MEEKLLNYTARIRAILAKNNTFGIYDEDDIGQEIYLLIRAAERSYDPDKGDEFSFYYHFCKRRLKTLKRDKYLNSSLASADEKRKLNNCMELDESSSYYYNTDIEEIDREDLIAGFVDAKIPSHMRIDYLKLLEGCTLEWVAKNRLITAIKNIVAANNE